jgi:hypothetical protein
MVASPEVPKPHFGPDDGKKQAIYAAVGRASLAWTSIEYQLGHWFAEATGMQDRRLSHGTFFSVSGFANRKAMFVAALRLRTLSVEQTNFLQAATKKADQWVATRNLIAHGGLTNLNRLDANDERVFVVTDNVFAPGWAPPTQLTVEQLECAAFNFNRLAGALFDASIQDQSPTTPRLPVLLLQVRLLPNDPTILESVQIRRARAQQMLADDQKRAAHEKSKPPAR